MGARCVWLGYGGMRLIVPDPLTLDPGSPSQYLPGLREYRDIIKNNPMAWAMEKVSKIDEALVGSASRAPLLPRVVSPGNISMYDYLQDMKFKLENNPISETEVEVTRSDMFIASIEQESNVVLVFNGS